MNSAALRAIALQMLDRAHIQRNEAEHRVWVARDHRDTVRTDLDRAESALAISERELERAQQFLEMVWSDIRPLGLPDPDVEAGPAPVGDASDAAALGPDDSQPITPPTPIVVDWTA